MKKALSLILIGILILLVSVSCSTIYAVQQPDNSEADNDWQYNEHIKSAESIADYIVRGEIIQDMFGFRQFDGFGPEWYHMNRVHRVLINEVYKGDIEVGDIIEVEHVLTFSPDPIGMADIVEHRMIPLPIIQGNELIMFITIIPAVVYDENNNEYIDFGAVYDNYTEEFISINLVNPDAVFRYMPEQLRDDSSNWEFEHVNLAPSFEDIALTVQDLQRIINDNR
jgi:hypothetical protein